MNKVGKQRIDKLIVEQGLTESREQAKRLIMAGQIYDQNNQRYDKAGEKVSVTTQLHIKGKKPPYVSRGGFKLEKALKVFDIDLTDKIALDIGASTGGFTDVMLQAGAQRVYALDVGYNQLVYSLRQDPRVIVMERVNFRYATPDMFAYGQPTFASIDVSFISLSLILPPLKQILSADGQAVALIKPQFEAGPERVGKNGIIKDKQVHQDVLNEILTMIQQLGYTILDVSFSPITGGGGNIEFLVHLSNESSESQSHSIDVEAVVEAAHIQLK